VAAVSLDTTTQPYHWVLKVADGNGERTVLQPSEVEAPLPFHSLADLLGHNCSAWRSDDDFLLQTPSPDSSVHWVSIQPQVEPRLCRSFPGEMICGQVISPDGSIIAVVTTSRDLMRFGSVLSDVPVYLNILNNPDCQVSRRIALPFPEQAVWRARLLAPKNKYLDNAAFLKQMAARMAISPDNTKLAISYGVYKDPDGVAFWGLYSLPDARRLATLRGDTYRGGLWRGWLNDQLYASIAPITGAMQFSPDSRMLFATSKHVWQWDVSGLR
jgi:hypothetical protein